MPDLLDIINGEIYQFILYERMGINDHNGFSILLVRGVDGTTMPFEFSVIDDANFHALVRIMRAVCGGRKLRAVLPVIRGIIASIPVYGTCTQ